EQDAGKLDIWLNNSAGTSLTKVTTDNFSTKFGQPLEIGQVVVTKCHAGDKMEAIVTLTNTTTGKNSLCVVTVTGTTLSYSGLYALDVVPINIVTGKLNNDDLFDIFVSDGNIHQTLLGQSNGTFQAQTAVIANADFMAVYSADFNGDGMIDTLAVGKRFAWFIPGDSTQSPSVVVDFTSLGITPKDIAFGDFNNDGKTDFAVLNHVGDAVYVFTCQATGAGSPNFTRSSTLSPFNGKQLLVTNFDNAHGDDIVVYGVDEAGFGGSNLQTFLSNSSGGFSTVKTTTLNFAGNDVYDLLAIGEVTNDGYIDIVAVYNGTTHTASTKNSYYQVLVNIASDPGRFQQGTKADLGNPATTNSIKNPTAAAIGDMYGDGKNELVILDAESKSVWILQQTAASGTFGTTASYMKPYQVTGLPLGNAAFSTLALANFNEDSRLDVLVGVWTTNGNLTFGILENKPDGKGNLLTSPADTTETGGFAGANASGLAFHVGRLDDNGTADVVIVGGNTVKQFLNTDKSGAEIGTVTLVIRDYNSTLVSTEIVDLNTLSDRLIFIDEWSNFWVEIWANTGTSVGISSFTTSLTFNADIFEVRSGKIEYGASVSQLSIPDETKTGVITLSGTVSGSRGANANNTLLARVSFMPVAGGATTPGQTETKGILLNYSTNTASVQPITNGFALDATKSSLTTTSNATGQPAPALLGTVPLFPVIYDINDDGVVDARDFTQFVRALIAGSVSASSAPLFARLCDYNLDGVIDPRDFTWFAMNLADGLSREACRADPSLKVAFPPVFTQVPLTSAIAPAMQISLLAEWDDDVIAPLAGTLAPVMQQQSLSDQSTQNQALMAFIASQETKNDDFDLDIPNQASDTERLLAEGKL
ncbi:MAG: dockerin type I domain-containing protein, partial [Planctomycetaceae bacterium]|nr:dockerin type I domain-containing protein [Planctomycetaceae bacterium]